MEGVVLSDTAHVTSLLAMSGDKTNLLILAPARVVKTGVSSERTQMLVNKDGKAVTRYAFATFAGSSRHSIIHPAADVRLEESIGVQVTMKAVKDLVAENIYADFSNKDKVCACLAKFMHEIRIVQHRCRQEPEAQTWTIEAPRSCLPQLLALSGRDNITLTIPRSEEASLDSIPVFVDALTLDQVWRSIAEVPHYGVVGLTQHGQAIVRAPRTGVGAVRSRALGQFSPYSRQWDLVVAKRYMGKFTSRVGMESIASSIATSLSWACVALQTRRIGKSQQMITLGAAEAPPTLNVAINGEIAVLTEVMDKENGLKSTFAPVLEVRSQDTDQPMEQVAAASALPAVLQEKCEHSLRAVTNQSEQQCKQLLLDTEKKLTTLQDQLKDEFKKFAED